MKVFIAPDGQEYDVDETSAPAMAHVRQNGWKPAGEANPATKDTLKSIVSGGLEGVARAPLIGGDLIKLGMGLTNKLGDPDVPLFSPERMESFGSQSWIDAFKGSDEDKALKSGKNVLSTLPGPLGLAFKGPLDVTYEPNTKAGRYTKNVTSAITGAAATGGLGSLRGPLSLTAAQPLTAAKVALSPSMIALNGGSSAAGELAYDLSRKFDDTVQGNPLLALGAGLGVGTLGHSIRALRSSNFPQEIFSATKNTSPDEWANARRSLGDFERSGSSTFTLADLPELQSKLGGTAQGISNAAGGDLMRQKLSLQRRMNEDIPQLLARMREEIAPPVNSGRLANQLANQTPPMPPGVVSNLTLPRVAENLKSRDHIISALRSTDNHLLGTELNSLKVTPEQVKQLARIMADKAKPIPNLTGAQGSTALRDRELLEGLLKHAGLDLLDNAKNKLGVADSLSRLTAEHGQEVGQAMQRGNNAISTLVSPFGTTARAANLRRAEKETEQLSLLLGNPTRANLEKLVELSKINPRAKRALEALSTTVGVGQNAALRSTGEEP